jgi:hypothetical protein
MNLGELSGTPTNERPFVPGFIERRRTQLTGLSTHDSQGVAGSSPARPTKKPLQSLMFDTSVIASALRNVSNARLL